jgi:putative transposase
MHNNPVKEGILQQPEHCLYRSAGNYADLPGLLDVLLTY